MRVGEEVAAGSGEVERARAQAERSGDKAKALAYSEKIVAIAGGADKTRTEVADARASLEKR